MRKFIIDNSSDKTVRLAIEPWAELEMMSPGAQILFEYEEYDEPAEIEFSVTNNNRIVVSIVSDLIKITGSSGEKIFRLPAGKWQRED